MQRETVILTLIYTSDENRQKKTTNINELCYYMNYPDMVTIATVQECKLTRG